MGLCGGGRRALGTLRAWAWCGGGVASRAEAAGWKPAGTQDGEGAEGEAARDGGGHVGGVVGLLK